MLKSEPTSELTPDQWLKYLQTEKNSIILETLLVAGALIGIGIIQFLFTLFIGTNGISVLGQELGGDTILLSSLCLLIVFIIAGTYFFITSKKEINALEKLIIKILKNDPKLDSEQIRNEFFEIKPFD